MVSLRGGQVTDAAAEMPTYATELDFADSRSGVSLALAPCTNHAVDSLPVATMGAAFLRRHGRSS